MREIVCYGKIECGEKMNLDYKAIGIRIKEKRSERAITQDKLAELSGLSNTHMSHVETGNTKVSLPALLAIANGLETSIDSLVIDNLVSSRGIIESEISAYMQDCSDAEMHIIMETVKSLKESLRRNRPKNVADLD